MSIAAEKGIRSDNKKTKKQLWNRGLKKFGSDAIKRIQIAESKKAYGGLIQLLDSFSFIANRQKSSDNQV